jgi:hypothetical protein
MSVKPLIVFASLAALLGATLPSLAQSSQSSGPRMRAVRRPPAQIEINPRPLLHRRCTAWYELQARPSGTVVFPRTHCWWVRG